MSRSPNVQVSTLVIFDSRVQDLDVLYRSLLPDSFGYTIADTDDALNVITQLLSATGATRLAIAAHGESGVVHLGANPLNGAQVLARAGLLQEWCVQEIALYACEVASGATGADFVNLLANVTGASVAASVSKVGNSALGGTWDLGVTVGATIAPMMSTDILADYRNVLPETVIFSTSPETLAIAGSGINTTVTSTVVGAPSPFIYSNTSDGLQVNGGETGTNTFNVNSTGTGFNFNLDLILIGSGFTNGDVVNVNANPRTNDFIIDQVQTINVASAVGITTGDLTGDAGDVNWKAGRNIVFNTGSSLTTTAGTVTLLSQGSTTTTGTSNSGVDLTGSNTNIASVNGAISITGTGSSGTRFNFGVLLFNGGQIASTGTATITVNGQGSSTSTGADNQGVRVDGANSRIDSLNGAIAVRGTGGSGTDSNAGVLLLNGGQIASTGTATVTVNGQGSSTSTGTDNQGVRVDEANSLISSVGGAIAVSGTGGSGTDNNIGVLIRAGGLINSTGTGVNAANINVIGQAGGSTNTGSLNQGVRLNGGTIQSVDGAITVTGTARNGTGSNSGVIVTTVTGAAAIQSTGTGAITVTGTAGSGTASDGIRLELAGAKVQSNSGAINLIGTASGTNFGINILTGTSVTSTTGQINLLGNTINLDNTATISTVGNVFINSDADAPVGATTLGATVNVTAGTLFLNDTIKVDYNTALSSFDTLNLTGAVDLVGSSLEVDFTNYTASADQVFTLINNDGTDAVTGTFTGLAEGTQVGLIGGLGLFITYRGNATTPSLANIGTGNDVQLYFRNNNTAPANVSLSNSSINENVAASSLIGNFDTTDSDINEVFTYSLVGVGNDNASFTLSSSGQLTINDSPDFEAKSSFSIRVRTTDAADAVFEKDFSIAITNVNEAPNVNLAIADQAIENGKAFNFTFGSNVFIDPENDPLSFSASGLPNWLKFNAIARTFSGTANGVGTSTISLSANDGTNTTSTDFSLVVNTPLIIPPILAQIPNSDIFTIAGSDTLKLKVLLTDTKSSFVNEVGVFVVDDASGKINGLSVGDAGYSKAALDRAKVIFSTIANKPTGFDANNLGSLIEFTSGANLRFYLVKNSSTEDALKSSNFSNVLFSSSSTLKITDLGSGSYTLDWEDGSGTNDFKDIILKVLAADDALAIGTSQQSNSQGGEVLDLRFASGLTADTKSVRADFIVNREAAFNNFVGFYKVADVNGGIDTNGDGIADITTGQSGYTQAAIRGRVSGIDLTVNNQGTAFFTGVFNPNSIFAPFIIVNGTPDLLLDNNTANDPTVYFPFLGSNSDGVDHIRMLGNNVFGFEDLPNGGDRDFNDMIVKVTLTAIK